MTPIEHAAQYPNEEICGIMVGDKYYPAKNTAKDKKNNFRIAKKDWRADATAIVHSHPDGYRYLSTADRQQQVLTGLPYHLIAGGECYVYRCCPLLRGREFVYGKADCYALLRDAYMLAGIDLPERQRTDIESDSKAERFKNELPTGSFFVVSDLQPGDIMLSNVGGHANHVGVYLGDDQVLHHPAGQLSRIEPVGSGWMRYVESIWRHPEMSAEKVEAIKNDLEAYTWQR
ncbi:NlpC/P60 family protein [Suttonella ornithocola]|uniref:NlpC/P60 family n=1 Tax=Suttonella ornithocola TaxID=279832 RepID=A0A380MRU3_9GAMM|nr:NlpC/P60 family protein [Suttonella ornithocola]SUO95285.1 NlpC/P60 family [Suttonella ornithocola]